MKPLQLVMSGWGCYSEEVKVDFTKFRQEGLFLVTGPTGAGKTTIFDGISYALFGNVSGKFREKDMVRSDFASADTETFVELRFSHKGENYSIHRSPRYERAKKRGTGVTTTLETAIFCKEGESPVTSVPEVNRRIEELMGLNYMQFKQIAMIAQGEFAELLFSSSGDRTAILRNLFQTAQYDRLQKHLAERAKHIFRNREEMRNRMDEAAAMIDSGNEEELTVLLSEETYRYESICEKTDALIEEDRKTTNQLEQERLQFEHKKQEYLLAIQSGKKRNETIDTLEAAEEQQKKLEEERPEIVKKESRLKRAEAAEKVYQEERMYKVSQTRRSVAENKRKETAEKKLKLEAEAALCEQERGNILLLEEAMRGYEQKYQELKGYLPIISDLVQVTAKLSAEEKLQKKSNKEIFHWKEELALLQKDQNKDIAAMEQCGEPKEELVQIQVALAEENHRLKEAEQAILCWKERIKLQKDLKSSQKKYQKAEEKLAKERHDYEEKESLYRQAAIGLAARYLKENMPCPVCGSLEHPNKAEISSDVPDQDEMEMKKKQLDLVEEEYNQIYRQAATKNGILQAKTKEWNLLELRLLPEIPPFSAEEQKSEEYEKQTERNLFEYYETLTAAIAALLQQSEELSQRKLKKEALIQKIEKRKEQCTEAEEKIHLAETIWKESVSRQNVLSENHATCISRLPNEYRSEKQVNDGMEDLVEKNRNCRTKAEAHKKREEEVRRNLSAISSLEKSQITELESAIAEEQIEQKKFLSILKEQGFAEETSYRSAQQTEEDRQNLLKNIQAFYEKLQRSEVYIEKLHQDVPTRERCLLDDLAAALKESEEQEQSLQKQKESVHLRLQGNQKAIALIKKRFDERRKLEDEYGIIRDLDKAARGENREKLVFEQFVLSYYFEDILSAANSRFRTMTGGRYELQKVSKVYDARTKDSLDLEVLDFYTGKCRSVKSLSGGESFKAALSFALGMSDTIQRYAGGIEIDTLFIDEGFGSLDPESLDQALNTIVEQSGKGRLIGIISHVAELKERLDQQIVVEKTAVGSRLVLLK